MSKSSRPRGFASIDKRLQKEIASRGGRAVPKEKRSFSVNKELASEAGRKGGMSKSREEDQRMDGPQEKEE